MQRINLAILDAFEPESLARLVRYTFDKNIEDITQARDFTSTVFYLTRWADSSGQMEKLLGAAREAAPENPALRDLEYKRDSLVKRSTSEYLMDQHESLSLIILKVGQIESAVDQIERELEQIRQIVIGPLGDNGLRSVSRENKKELESISAKIDNLERKLNGPTDAFASSVRLKVGFAATFTLLLIIVMMNVLSVLGIM